VDSALIRRKLAQRAQHYKSRKSPMHHQIAHNLHNV
jgi:hypothetical protein